METEKPGCRGRAAVVLAVAVGLLLLLIGLLAFEVLFFAGWRHEHGYTYGGADYKWHQAMNRGDPATAKYWAQRMIDYAGRDRRIPDRLQRAHQALAEAQELAGELEEALSLYEHDGSQPLGAARVYFKLGRNEEAFRAYCAFALENKKSVGRRGGTTMGRGEAEVLRLLTAGSDTADFPYKRNLIPFRYYMDFMFFMEWQWEKTGNDEKCREAMEYLREAASPHESETIRIQIESRRLRESRGGQKTIRVTEAMNRGKPATAKSGHRNGDAASIGRGE